MKARLLLIASALVLCGCQNPQPSSRTSSTYQSPRSDLTAPDVVAKSTPSTYQSSRSDFTVPDAVAKSAQYPPKPTDFREEVKRYLRLRLKDPDSAIYEKWTLGRAYLGSNPPVYGWMSTVSVNAKNSFGGYAGFEHYIFWHEDGRAKPAVSLPYTPHLVDLDFEEILKK